MYKVNDHIKKEDMLEGVVYVYVDNRNIEAYGRTGEDMFAVSVDARLVQAITLYDAIKSVHRSLTLIREYGMEQFQHFQEIGFSHPEMPAGYQEKINIPFTTIFL